MDGELEGIIKVFKNDFLKATAGEKMLQIIKYKPEKEK
jgi:hypothetical protein